jgi:hypothetical protein
VAEQELPAVFVGLDVGKSDHHAVAVTAAGKTVYDKALPNDETRLRAILEELAAEHGPVLMAVDQPATIGALPVAVAEATDSVQVAYLPGLTMRRIADLHPGTAKTDARDAAIIAEAARTMPHTLRNIRVDEAQIGRAGRAGRLRRRPHHPDHRHLQPPTRNSPAIHPALERVLGPRVTHPAVADLLARYPTPAKLAAAGRGHVRARLKKHAPRLAESLAEEIFDALGQQTVVVAGTEAAATVVPILAGQLAALIHQRATVAAQVEALVEAHPQSLRPDLDARYRRQDRREDPHRSRRQGLPRCRAPGLLRRDRPCHQTVGNLDPRRARTPRWEQEAQTGAVPLKRSPRSATPPRGRTTTGNAPRANATTRRSSPWPAAGPTSCSPCSGTAPSIKTRPTLSPRHPWSWPLDGNHRGPPGGFANKNP